MIRLALLSIATLLVLVFVAACDSADAVEPTEGLDFVVEMQPRTVAPTEDRVTVRPPGPTYRATVTIMDNRIDDDPDGETMSRRDRCRDGLYFFSADDGEQTREAQARACSFSFSFDSEGEFTTRLEVRTSDGEVLASTEEQTINVRDFLIVSLGDSVASGEGNPDQGRLFAIFGDETVWQDRQCHRSFKAGSAKAALEIERMDPGTTVTFVHLACSGARITTGLLDQYRGIEPDAGAPLPPQIAQLRELLADPSIGGSPEAPREVDALMLTIGANDLRFGTIVQRCLLNDEDDGSCQAARFRGEETVQQAVDRLLGNLDGRFGRLAACLGEGDCQAGESLGIDPERVLITEYFDPTQSSPGKFCRHPRIPFPRFNLTREEARWAKFNVVDPLNEKVRDAAAAHGWTLVDGLAEDFANHGICKLRPSRRWVVRITRALTVQLGIAGAFHPDGQGHSCYRNRLTPALAGVLGDELGGELPRRSTCV